MAEEALAQEQESKAEAKARKKEEKKQKKLEKKAAKENAALEEEAESGGGKLVVALATIIIIAIWLGILALLIRLDVGGFGSTVLYPILKDVPYVNKILPEVFVEDSGIDPAYPYKNLDEAIARIKELESQLAGEKKTGKNKSAKVEELQAQVRKLEKYRDNAVELEKQKQQFYDEVVFADQAPAIAEYQKYYEMIAPDNAEVLYKKVVEQQQYDAQVEDFIKTYSASGMKPKDAAAIFEAMPDNLQLVKRILNKLSAADRGNILAAISDKTISTKLTEMLEPSKN